MKPYQVRERDCPNLSCPICENLTYGNG